MDRYINWLDNRKKWIAFAGTLLLIIFTVYAYSKGIFTQPEKLDALLRKCGILAPVVFVIIQAVQVVIPILPGSVGCVFGVLFFGPLTGFIYNYIGICIGSVAAFLIARTYGKDFVKKVTGGKFFEKYSNYLIKENQFEKLFALLIFLPVAPDDFLCYLAGVSEMKLRKFTAIILLGKPAAIFLYSMGLTQIFHYTVRWLG